jgi:glucose-1-phosphate thymidylyltransferase
MKGIILAGGKATRLYPITKGICKQLLPVYDKPMIYYPLSALMLAGIRDILIISTPDHIPHFKNIFGNGQSLGLKISYKEQPQPKGLAQAFILGEDFIGSDRVCLVLGDNIFYGDRLGPIFKAAASSKKAMTIFAYSVNNPQSYGVVEFDAKKRPVKIAEKPRKPKSKWAVTGIYFFDNRVVDIAKKITPSARGELEITDVINAYMKKNSREIIFMGRGMAWLDTGTYDSLIDASLFIKITEERQGLKIGCIEEIAYREGFIDQKQLLHLAKNFKTSYGSYLKKSIKYKEHDVD